MRHESWHFEGERQFRNLKACWHVMPADQLGSDRVQGARGGLHHVHPKVQLVPFAAVVVCLLSRPQPQ